MRPRGCMPAACQEPSTGPLVAVRPFGAFNPKLGGRGGSPELGALAAARSLVSPDSSSACRSDSANVLTTRVSRVKYLMSNTSCSVSTVNQSERVGVSKCVREW